MADISSDPRVGSSRDNSTGTTISSAAGGSNSSSGTTLIWTLLPVSIFAFICVAIFVTLRRKYPRVYSPRTLSSILPPYERSSELPTGWFNWLIPSAKVPDTFVLNHSTLDGFLFLRYMKILAVIAFVGCCITWPTLIPLHVHGGGALTQLDLLTFGNITDANYCYVHVTVAWLYFGFILYMISRECVYYVNLRQAYLLSPYYASRLSSRTVLFACVPRQELDEARLRKIFGDSVKNVWISRGSEELDQLVKEREQTALRLEKAEIELIKKANKARKSAIGEGNVAVVGGNGSDPALQSELNVKTGAEASVDVDPVPRSTVLEGPETGTGLGAHSPGPIEGEEGSNANPESAASQGDSGSDGATPAKAYAYVPPADINGSVAAQWLPHEARPRHRPLANYGRRVDTIKWTRQRLKLLAPKINKLRRQMRTGKGKAIPAVFIEFDSQVNAQSAFQALTHHRAMHMSPRFIGIRPHEVVWSSLRMVWWERVIRKFLVQAFIAVMILFWSIPCAFVGIISNIKLLSVKVPFLHWIQDLPSPILGLLTGLLPAAALSFLMSLVPAIMRSCARAAGTPSRSLVELYCQSSYMVFQVVQVFLITTLTSAASASFAQILENPPSATTLLSANLPKASNFYVSYFILQGLATSASRLVHFSALLRHQILAKSSDNPRFLSQKWHRLRHIHWGGIFPVYTNMGVIAISYACIAPLTLGFATIGFYLVYLSYRYNLIYVYDSEVDTRGLLYPRALKQLLIGVYLAEICLVGLFGLRGAAIPVVLMLILLVFTVLIQFSLSEALGPLLFNLPKTLAIEGQDQHPANGSRVGDGADVEDLEKLENDFDFEWPETTGQDAVVHGEQTTRAIEGAEASVAFVSSSVKAMVLSKIKTLMPVEGFDGWMSKVDFWTRLISPDPNVKPKIFIKWLHPEVYADYSILRKMIPPDAPDPALPEDYARKAYYPPSIMAPTPVLWIPRDAAGVSQQEVAHSSKVIHITNEGAHLDEKTNRIFMDLEEPSPVVLERILY